MDNLNWARKMREPAATEGASGHLTIDLSALRRNYRKLSALSAPVPVAAVVKADAYGLGAESVSRALLDVGCRDFFVAQFAEAVALRPHLPRQARIFVLNGLQPGNERVCAADGIIPVINSQEQLARWTETARHLGRVLPAVLQFDTGMSRLGIPPEAWMAVAAATRSGNELEILFVMSHLASADEGDNPQNGDQLAAMGRVAELFPGIGVSFANSGGVFLGSDFHGALARPGIALYGGAPTAGLDNPMEPVIRLDIAVIQVRTVPAGTRIGYGGTHVTTGERRLATLSAGYADGLPRSLSDRGAVYFDGVRLPIVGRVSMDSMTVDISDIPADALTLGSLVEMIGPHQTLEDVGRDAGTIAYEILTGLGHRYHRVYR